MRRADGGYVYLCICPFFGHFKSEKLNVLFQVCLFNHVNKTAA